MILLCIVMIQNIDKIYTVKYSDFDGGQNNVICGRKAFEVMTST
jgi:hypothetical protein